MVAVIILPRFLPHYLSPSLPDTLHLASSSMRGRGVLTSTLCHPSAVLSSGTLRMPPHTHPHIRSLVQSARLRSDCGHLSSGRLVSFRPGWA